MALSKSASDLDTGAGALAALQVAKTARRNAIERLFMLVILDLKDAETLS